jgi:hypothetical protein
VIILDQYAIVVDLFQPGRGRIDMVPVVDLYYSPYYSELIVVPNRYSSDHARFQFAATAHPHNYPADALGHEIKAELANFGMIDMLWEEISALITSFEPLAVSQAVSMDDFQQTYYPFVVSKRDRAYWIGAAVSEVFRIEPMTLPVLGCSDQRLGEAVYYAFGLLLEAISDGS